MNKSIRKRNKLKYTTLEFVFEACSALSLIILIAIPIYYFVILPDKIPRHFNAFGKPDSFAAKGIIWLLPSIGVILYTALSFLQKIPQHFNYIVELTEKNIEQQFRISIRLLQSLKLIICIALNYVLFASIQTAFGNWDGLSPFFMPGFMVLILVTIIFYLIQSYLQK